MKMSDTIAAFEELVDKLMRPDAELTQSEIELRKRLGDSVCTIHRRVVDNRIAVAKKRLEERE